VEALVFATSYERLAASVEDQAVLVRGLVLPEENAPPKISVQDIVPLEVARVNLPSLISIRVARWDWESPTACTCWRTPTIV
jgi:DNA polymerase III subunit alpha